MAKGALLPLLAVAAVAAYALSKKSATINTTPSTPQNGLPPGTGKYDTQPAPPNAVMPMTLEQTVTSELASDTNIANLTALATALAPMWPNAVALLNARIAQLQAQPAPNPSPTPPPVPPPVVVPPMPVTPPTPAPVVPPPPAPTPAPVAVTYPQWATTTSGTAGMTNGPDVSSVAIPAAYMPESDETTAVQTALNAAATQLGFPLAQLTVDGLYGPGTQQMAAMFQQYVNDTSMAPSSGSFTPLTVDGLAGPSTQAYLLNFGTIPTGGPY